LSIRRLIYCIWRERLILDDVEKSLDGEEKASDDKRVLRDKKSCVGWRIHDAQQACQGDRCYGLRHSSLAHTHIPTSHHHVF
jgi:hypothetical protein